MHVAAPEISRVQQLSMEGQQTNCSLYLQICHHSNVAYIVNPRCTENSEFDVQHTHSSIAQLAEHSTVNRRVTGSSPVGGADNLPPSTDEYAGGRGFLLFRLCLISSGRGNT